MRQKPFSGSIVFSGITFLILTAACAQEPLPFSGKINSDNINVRSDSTPNAPIICTLEKGKQVEVVTDLYGWYKVRLPKRAAVYIKKSLTECSNYKPEDKTCLNAKVTKERVNIRLKPSDSAAILGMADKNETVHILRDEGSWYKIEPCLNSFGWIHKKFVDRIPDNSSKH